MCPYYCFKDGLFGGDYWCNVVDRAVPDSVYRSMCKDYTDYKKCANYIQKGNQSSGCFITTVVHTILHNPDNCKVLNDFRNFREDVLKKNPKYYEGLKEYDVIGPAVACRLGNDKDAYDMAKMTYEIDLLKVHKFYLTGEYDKAYDWYCKMTYDLISYYGLDDLYHRLKNINFGIKEFHPELAGHGKVKIK